jgi:dGTPase
MARMDWEKLMCPGRLTATGALEMPSLDQARTDYERDWDRILFSSALRRMHDKTQVFPLPIDDFVHSRLTHSLEAASVGRSLGNQVMRILAESDKYVQAHRGDIAAVVAAACLAHDIGNPPFGHAGEAAIGAYFRGAGREHLTGLDPREKCDLQEFEGNAQGFRLLARLQHESTGGLKLTAACLGAFSKYPRESGRDLITAGDAGTAKHGLVQADLSLFQSVAAATGMLSHDPAGDRHAWRRHHRR